MTKLLKSTRSIKFKLISTFILLILIPLASLGINSYIKSSNIMKEYMKDTNVQSVKQTKQSIEYYKSEYNNSMNQMLKDPNIQQINNDTSLPWAMKSFKAFLESHKDIESIYIGTPDKKFYRYPEKTMDTNYDPTSRPWYKEALEKKAIIWTTPYIATSTNKLIISIAAPVYNDYNNKEFVGIMAMDISLEALSNNINSIKIGENGYPILLDKNLNILTHKDNTLVGKALDQTEILRAVSEKNEGYTEYVNTENGVSAKKITSFTKIDDLGWTILGTMYESEITEHTSKMLYNTVIIGIISLIIAFAISLLFTNGLTRPIKELLNTMNKIKNGDFTTRCNIKSKDEIGELSEGFNEMVNSISGLIKNIQAVSENVNLSSTNLAAIVEETSASSMSVTKAVEEIAVGASQEALETETVATLTSKLSARLNELESNTDTMLKYTQEVTTVNLHGVEVVGELRNKNQLNESAINNIEDAIIELNDKTKNITRILNTISSISEQTNLLALNASIEAARAGEAGKGFAVVADEIRKLAEGSNHATSEINEIITNIQAESSNTVERMKEVKEISLEQTISVDKVNDSFNNISESINSIAENIKSLNNFVNGINKDKESIVEAIQNISAISEETAAASEEVTASMQQQLSAIQEVENAAEKLSDNAENLNYEIEKFKI